MKYAIMSDIHGNLEAFSRAVADARKRKCNKIICLGDITGYCKQSKECVEYAMWNVDMCLMGNHDSACCELEDPDVVAENRNFDVDVVLYSAAERERTVLSWDYAEYLREFWRES